jgi:hypothetical protein
MRKKAQGLPLNIVIVAIIALIVLGVIIFIFYDQIKKVATGFTETREKSQICQTGWVGGQRCIKADSCPAGWQKTSARCEEEGEICCEKKPAEETS